jgi:aspartate aminotransferase
MHALYVATHALVEAGDEVILPNPVWTATPGHVLTAHATPVSCPLYESRGWTYDIDELISMIGPRTRAILINTPHNPTGGILDRPDLERIAEAAQEHDLWVISDEAYEDVVYDGTLHVSIASLPGMYERTVPIYTFSKSYAMTGLRLGYLATPNAALRERIAKLVGYTASSVSTPIQWGAIGGMEHTPTWIPDFQAELQSRRDFFYEGIAELGSVLSGAPPRGAFYAFLRIVDGWQSPSPRPSTSVSWAFAEHLIETAKVGCIPGVDFGSGGEGYIRFCFSRERAELAGALDAMRRVL